MGIFLGGSYYLGELNPRKHLNETTRPAVGGIFRFNYDERVTFRAHAMFGTLQADDASSKNAYQQQRNLNFKSNIYEAAVLTEFNFVPYRMSSAKKFFSPYMFIGLAFFHFSPTARIENNWFDLRNLGTEGQKAGKKADPKRYRLNQLSVPFGAGVRLNIAKKVGFSIEWGLRKTWTDYLDDISSVYIDKGLLANQNGPLAAIMSDRSVKNDPQYANTGRMRGNVRNKDWYSFVGIILTIELPGKASACDAYHGGKRRKND